MPESTEGRIQLLPEELIDQIAAGEVVERPASVVKELVENALDAGAERIRIAVRDGGKALIAVTDDGLGMTPGEARRALCRHATSKLRTLEDLDRVSSFGFRGEALPAIASVSTMRFQTRSAELEEGIEISIEGGRIRESKSVGGPVGTRIEVVDLFAQVPARRKFLKSSGTEWGHIADWIGRLAMALPGVHFELRRDDRPPLVWPAVSDPLDRIAAVLGESEAAALVLCEIEAAGAHLQAYVSAPDRTRPNANGIHLFVNGRPVRDKTMRHALQHAYRDLLPRGRHPSGVLFLVLPPGKVDVNVHPAKWEVRFADAQAIHQLIRRAVRKAMQERRWLKSQSGNAEPRTGESPGGGWRPPSETSSWTMERGRDAARLDSLPGFAQDEIARERMPQPGYEALRFGELRRVGQLLATYLLVEAKDGLLLVDQHAAHERVLYERLRAQWLDRAVERQGLLLPMTVELEPLAAAALEEHRERIAKLGFEIAGFGASAVVVRALPALLSGRDPAALVRNLAAELQSQPAGDNADAADDTRLMEAADQIFATLACHSARRAGDHLEPREQQRILEDLDSIPWAPTCPHGRPVAIAFDLAEIERRFSRR